MLKGIGTDLIELSRVERVYAKHGSRFVQRVLTDLEIIESQARKNICNYLAKQFAAKEAVSKALGVGIGSLSFKDIQVLRNELGKPEVELSLQAKKKFSDPKIHLSLSDTKNSVIAFCVIEH